jgi:hypothetical protein
MKLKKTNRKTRNRRAAIIPTTISTHWVLVGAFGLAPAPLAWAKRASEVAADQVTGVVLPGAEPGGSGCVVRGQSVGARSVSDGTTLSRR